MYQKFIPKGSVGIQIFSKNGLEKNVIQQTGSNAEVINHLADIPDLEDAYVEDGHILVLD